MTNKQILIGCASALVIIVVLASAAGYLVYRRFAPFFSALEVDTPEGLKQPRIVLGSELLEKRTFLQTTDLGNISSIVFGELDPRPGEEVCVVGETGALFVDRQGNPFQSISFAKPYESIAACLADSTGREEILMGGEDQVLEYRMK